ncbi:hypothetical protein EVAR_104009_1 [Eumeta japonica]|uniref:Uncharacterized protein n=1 Tax=Eumeta variegata TaxID=151549 RepID=A0A4C1Y0G4_EUMVA|nr:hypothetical protein EVAR_104009_1 [Eumeta japonica]
MCRNSDIRQQCRLKKSVVTRVERDMLQWFSYLRNANTLSGGRILAPCGTRLMRKHFVFRSRNLRLRDEAFYHHSDPGKRSVRAPRGCVGGGFRLVIARDGGEVPICGLHRDTARG